MSGSTPGPRDERVDAPAIRRDLLEQWDALATPGVNAGGLPSIKRVEVPVDGLDPLAWLAAQPPGSRGYWRDRESDFELAGVGKAEVVSGDDAAGGIEALKLLHERLAATAADLRYFGGARFMERAAPGEEWACFKAYRYILPRFEVVRRNGWTVVACNALAGEGRDAVAADLATLRFPVPCAPVSPPRPTGRQDCPDLPGWTNGVRAALDSFRRGDYEKVVLARRVHLVFNEVLDAAAWLRHLAAATHDRFYFCFQPNPTHAFIGGSPERLYRRDGARFFTEAMAGTRARGRTAEDDERLRRELLEDAKERREQAYVVEGIEKAARPLCAELEHDTAPRVLRLSRGQHLVTRFRGQLRDGVPDGALLEALHPTPAVGGYPTQRALEDIARFEPFDRGWYAGPVGWLSRDAAQYAVGIRSALVTGRSLYLYSGAGIVQGSEPEREWAELENKISDFLNLFGGTS